MYLCPTDYICSLRKTRLGPNRTLSLTIKTRLFWPSYRVASGQHPDAGDLFGRERFPLLLGDRVSVRRHCQATVRRCAKLESSQAMWPVIATPAYAEFSTNRPDALFSIPLFPRHGRSFGMLLLEPRQSDCGGACRHNCAEHECGGLGVLPHKPEDEPAQRRSDRETEQPGAGELAPGGARSARWR